MEKKFSPGQMVILISGGPPMTVVKYSENGPVICQWTSKSGKPETSEFEEAVLKLSNPSPPRILPP